MVERSSPNMGKNIPKASYEDESEELKTSPRNAKKRQSLDDKLMLSLQFEENKPRGTVQPKNSKGQAEHFPGHKSVMGGGAGSGRNAFDFGSKQLLPGRIKTTGPNSKSMIGYSPFDRQQMDDLSASVALPAVTAMFRQRTVGSSAANLISPQNLPKTFDPEKVEKQKLEKCTLCRTSLGGVFKATHYNCSCCGCSVCGKCSLHKMQLSQQDQTPYRVCNQCHAQMNNAPLIGFYMGLLQVKEHAILGAEQRRQYFQSKVNMIKQQIIKGQREIEEEETQGEKDQADLWERYQKASEIYKRQKETNKSLKQVIQTEDFNIKQRKDEVSELTTKLHKQMNEQEAMQNQSNKISNDINQYIFLLQKYASYQEELLPEDMKSRIRRVQQSGPSHQIGSNK